MKVLSEIFSIRITVCLAICFSCLFYACDKKEREPLKSIRYIGSYNRDFNDLNEAHLGAAGAIGVSPVTSRDEAEHLKKKLKEVKNCDCYEVEELKHSIPYLVPKAFDLLNKIGENFSDSLKNLNAPDYKLYVTSIMRTKDDIKSLRKRNGNSTENSAHMYGTTFDISWARYLKNSNDTLELAPEQLKMVLASVLRDLKKENQCFVKHERKQGCFHITAR